MGFWWKPLFLVVKFQRSIDYLQVILSALATCVGHLDAKDSPYW